jgi:hypothetical protein
MLPIFHHVSRILTTSTDHPEPMVPAILVIGRRIGKSQGLFFLEYGFTMSLNWHLVESGGNFLTIRSSPIRFGGYLNQPNPGAAVQEVGSESVPGRGTGVYVSEDDYGYDDAYDNGYDNVYDNSCDNVYDHSYDDDYEHTETVTPPTVTPVMKPMAKATKTMVLDSR